MIRKRRKIKKMRGTRTCGGGNVKNRRGKGSRMGSGGWKKGQRNKLHYLKFKLKPDKGFNSPLKKKIRAINVGQLNDFEGEVDVTKLGYWKVLGGGELKKALVVKAVKFTKKAIEKIEGVGGKAIVIGEKVGA